MNLVLLGVNHKTAPIELRERLAIAPSELALATRSLLETPGTREALIFSTCNRVELVICQEAGASPLLEFIQSYFDVDPASIQPHLYEYRDEEVVRHLFRVAASLDSMVVGEPQILGQVKESYFAARSVGAVRTHLERLLQRAFAVAKRIRNETEIGASPVSVASVAVELARKDLWLARAKDNPAGGRRQNERAGRPPPGGAGSGHRACRQSHLRAGGAPCAEIRRPGHRLRGSL